MDQKQIGLLFKELRKKKSLTQVQLGELLKVSNRTISRWETGNNLPDHSILPELATLYVVSIDDLLAGESRNENRDSREGGPGNHCRNISRSDPEHNSIINENRFESIVEKDKPRRLSKKERLLHEGANLGWKS